MVRKATAILIVLAMLTVGTPALGYLNASDGPIANLNDVIDGVTTTSTVDLAAGTTLNPAPGTNPAIRRDGLPAGWVLPTPGQFIEAPYSINTATADFYFSAKGDGTDTIRIRSVQGFYRPGQMSLVTAMNRDFNWVSTRQYRMDFVGRARTIDYAYATDFRTASSTTTTTTTEGLRGYWWYGLVAVLANLMPLGLYFSFGAGILLVLRYGFFSGRRGDGEFDSGVFG